MNKGFRGGIETTTEALAEQFIIRGHNISIVCDKIGQNEKYRKKFQVVEIPQVNIIDSEQNINFLVEFFRDNKIDIAILQIYFPQTTDLVVKAVRTLNCVKLISCWHNCLILDLITAKGFKRYLTRLLFRVYIMPKRIHRIKKRLCNIYDKSNLMVLLSEKYCEQLKNFVPEKKFDDLRFIPAPLIFSQEIVDFAKKKQQLLFIGRFHEEQKRMSLILKTWERITKLKCYSNWRLKLVGSGPNEEITKVKSQAENLPRIDFEGWQNPKEYYEESSIFLMTSAFEGLPMTLIESQNFGCVPVAMDSFASLPDIIQNYENGFIVPNNDLEAFTEKVCLLMDNQELREKMGKNGIEFVKKFSTEKIVDKWETLFEELSK